VPAFDAFGLAKLGCNFATSVVRRCCAASNTVRTVRSNIQAYELSMNQAAREMLLKVNSGPGYVSG
jgi:hypothetical protein